MNLHDAMERLRAMGNEKLREINRRHGAGEDHFGVNLGDLRKLAKEIKRDHALALELWATGNVDARLLSTLIAAPKEFTEEDLYRLAHECAYFKETDWLVTNLIEPSKHRDALRDRLMPSQEELPGRAGWWLASTDARKGRLADPEGVLDVIESRLKDAPYRLQETMNFTLGHLGIYHLALRERCLQIGERLGVFKDYPTPKGCVTPYVPVWVRTMVERGEGPR